MPDDDDKLLTYAEIADMLGIAASTVRKYASDGRLGKPDDESTVQPRWRHSRIKEWDDSRPGRGRWRSNPSDPGSGSETE